MNAYSGVLPGGLDWSMTGNDLLDMLGQGSATGPYPNYQFETVTDDGYDLEITTTATDMEQLPDASMTQIRVKTSGG